MILHSWPVLQLQPSYEEAQSFQVCIYMCGILGMTLKNFVFTMTIIQMYTMML
jgi:hypothetical protein